MHEGSSVVSSRHFFLPYTSHVVPLRSWSDEGGYCDVADHPCRNITDGLECGLLTDADGVPMCKGYSYCMDECIECAGCLGAVVESLQQPFLKALQADPTNTSAAVMIARELCREVPEGLCDDVLLELEEPGAHVLALRPAAICEHLGMCDRSCMVPDISNVTRRVPLDLCSSSGVRPANGTSTTKAGTGLPKGLCRGSMDCGAPGLVCDFSKAVINNDVCLCDPETGLDRWDCLLGEPWCLISILRWGPQCHRTRPFTAGCASRLELL